MKIINEETLAETPFLKLVRLDCISPLGRRLKWDGTRRENRRAVSVVAVTKDEKIILVRQPRYLIGSEVIEFPAGLLDIKGENMIKTAKRELLEETGYEATDFTILLGGEEGLVNSPGMTDERSSLVVCKNAVKAAEPLENEETKPFLLDLKGAYQELKELAQREEVAFKVFGNLALAKDWYEGRRK